MPVLPQIFQENVVNGMLQRMEYSGLEFFYY